MWRTQRTEKFKKATEKASPAVTSRRFSRWKRENTTEIREHLFEASKMALNFGDTPSTQKLEQAMLAFLDVDIIKSIPNGLHLEMKWTFIHCSSRHQLVYAPNTQKGLTAFPATRETAHEQKDIRGQHTQKSQIMYKHLFLIPVRHCPSSPLTLKVFTHFCSVHAPYNMYTYTLYIYIPTSQRTTFSITRKKKKGKNECGVTTIQEDSVQLKLKRNLRKVKKYWNAIGTFGTNVLERAQSGSNTFLKPNVRGRTNTGLQATVPFLFRSFPPSREQLSYESQCTNDAAPKKGLGDAQAYQKTQSAHSRGTRGGP